MVALVVVFPLIQHVRSAIGAPQSGLETLMNQHLANPLAVSVLIQDSTGRWGVAARSRRVAVSSGQWGATVAGTVSPHDANAPSDNPVFACARREVSEELGINIGTITWDGLIIARQKMQPIALVSSRINRQWKDMIPLIRNARDWSFENAALYAIHSDHLRYVIRHAPLTDAAAYHLWLKIPSNRRLPRFINLHDDCLIAPDFKRDTSNT